MRLLDLFCGAGGAALGYYRAGFEVVGVDHVHQQHYPFEFHLADAMTFPLHGFDAVHASPPCQRFSVATPVATSEEYPDLIEPIRKRLRASGLPYVIENVGRAPLYADIKLCGTMFGLAIRRHRNFETNWLYDFTLPPCEHQPTDMAFDHRDMIDYLEEMDCYWMTTREAHEAIPPAYTQWLGYRLMRHLGGDPNPVDEVAAITAMPNLIRRTKCPLGHTITEEYRRKDGRTRCAVCERDWARVRMRKLRADRKAGLRD